jgi:hypothetical protein
MLRHIRICDIEYKGVFGSLPEVASDSFKLVRKSSGRELS